jgi:hypothetical protein
VPGIIRGIPNSVLVKALLPNLSSEIQLPSCAKGEASFEELDRLLKRKIRPGREQQMDVIWHEHELVYLDALLVPIISNHIEEEFAEAIRLQKERSLKRREGYKESADFLRCEAQG